MKKISTTKIFFDPIYLQNQSLKSKKLKKEALKAVIKKRTVDFIGKIKDIESKIDSYLNKNSDQAFVLVFVLAGLVYFYAPMFILWLNGGK